VNPLQAILSSFEKERQRPSLWLPVALAVGIVAYFAIPFEPTAAFCAIAVALPAFAAWLLRNKAWGAAIVAFVVFVTALGFASAKLEAITEYNVMLQKPTEAVSISGTAAFTDIMPDGLRITLTHPVIEGVAPNETPDSVRIKFKELTLDEAPETGSRIEAYGQLNPISGPVAPGGTDFRRIAYYKHLGGVGWSYGGFETTAPPAPENWKERLSFAMEKTRKTLAKHVYERLSGDVAAMTAARLNGEQTGISSKAADDMRIAGLTHLLSTSGFNVTLMALLIYFPLRAFFALIPWIALRYPIKKWAAGAAVFSAMGYTFLVGSQAATLRSLIMTAIAMLAIMSDRRAEPLRLVMLSAALCMLFVPSATLSASFQLSFAAVLCLISTSNLNSEIKDDTPEIKDGKAVAFAKSLGKIAKTSIIATAATAPFSIYHFQAFSLYGFAANMIAIPISSFIIMPAVLFAYLLAPFGLDGLFIDAAGIGTAATMRIASAVAAWPHSIFYLPAMPSAALIAISVGGLWFCLWGGKWRHIGFIPIFIGMLYPLYTAQPDFFVSPDGKFWAAKLQDGRLAASNVKKGKFVVDQWRQMQGNVDAIDADLANDEWMRCDETGCAYRRNRYVIAMPKTDTATLEDCDKADIIIAPFDVLACSSVEENKWDARLRGHDDDLDKTIIDAKTLSEYGAFAVYFNSDEMKIEASRSAKTKKLWEGADPPPT